MDEKTKKARTLVDNPAGFLFGWSATSLTLLLVAGTGRFEPKLSHLGQAETEREKRFK